MSRTSLLNSILIVLLIVSVVITSTMGAVKISIGEWFSIFGARLGFSGDFSPMNEAIIWNIRLPRVLMAVCVGAGLAISGAALQGLFRNPLADPSLIGISSGAALAAAFSIVAGHKFIDSFSSVAGVSVLSITAFVGAVSVSLLVYFLSREKRKTNVPMMLLAGIAIMSICEALTGLFIYMSDDAQLRNLTFWRLGSLGSVSWTMVLITGTVTLIAFVVFSSIHKAFNALSLGEQEALNMGIRVERIKKQIILLTSLVVGCAVAFCGIIGFVGLLVPHIIRSAGISDYRYLFTTAFLTGAILLCWTDMFSRTIAAPAEVPIGLITALTGAPFFLGLLYKQKSK